MFRNRRTKPIPKANSDDPKLERTLSKEENKKSESEISSKENLKEQQKSKGFIAADGENGSSNLNKPDATVELGIISTTSQLERSGLMPVNTFSAKTTIKKRFAQFDSDRKPTTHFRGETKSLSLYNDETGSQKINGISMAKIDGGLPSFSLYNAMVHQPDFDPKTLKCKRRVPEKLRPGFMYILNHIEFENPELNRVGSEKDEQALLAVLRDKFQLKTIVHRNSTVEQVGRLVEKIASKDFTEYSCVLIVILSHGGRHETIYAHDNETSYNIDDDILFPILRNETLKDKPKLFFIQACKGQFKADIKADSNLPMQAATEIFKFYSTFEGFVSWRKESGSIFIQTLCKHLDESGLTKDIKEIAEDVREDCKSKFQNLGQVPTVTSNLSKYKFGDYLPPKKTTEPAAATSVAVK